MTISVDIADRLYDYTDEEKAAYAVAEFQSATTLDDGAVIALWEDESDPRRAQLLQMIFDAVDANGSEKRARESVPGGISLIIEDDAD